MKKKIIVILVSFCFMFSLTACNLLGNIGNSDTGSDKTTETVYLNAPVDELQKTQPISVERYVVTRDTAHDTQVMYACTDNINNYFFFHLGYIQNVPIAWDKSMLYDGRVGELSLSFTETESYRKQVSITTNETISKTISETKSTSTTDSTSISATFGIEDKSTGVKGSITSMLSTATTSSLTYSEARGYTRTETETSVEEFVLQKTKNITYKIGKGCDYGYYRYTLSATCDAYAVVAYNLNTRTACYDYVLCAREASYYLAIDYSKDGFENDNPTDKLNFDLAVINQINLTPIGLPFVGKQVYDTIRITMNRYNCADNNGYDSSKPDSGAIEWHNGFELGELLLNGCERISGNDFKIGNRDELSLKYHVIQNLDDLPRRGSSQSTHIQSDSAKSAQGTNINSSIEKGAYWVRITYADHSQTQYNKTNFLNSTPKGTTIELLKDLDDSKSITKIEVIVVYELSTGAPGVLGIWWYSTPNWKCTYTLNFN